jgi:hypothetical protein
MLTDTIPSRDVIRTGSKFNVMEIQFLKVYIALFALGSTHSLPVRPYQPTTILICSVEG